MAALVQAPLSALAADIPESKFGYNISERRIVADAEEKKERIFNTSYEPNEAWWQSNQATYVKPSNPADDPLPAGFPDQVVTPSLWDGKVLIDQPDRWVYHFTPADIAVLNAAYDHFIGLNLPGGNNAISVETFPIPADTTLYAALKRAEAEIKSGLGFRVLRGLPVDDWERNRQLVIFAGISAYIGKVRLPKGADYITHLRDITNIEADKRPPIVVKGQTSGNQVFHNDGNAGLVSLITVGVAETGGLSQLSSVAQTYNTLARERRDIIRELASPTWTTKAYTDRALIHAVPARGAEGQEGTQVISNYARRPFFGFYESDADVPALPEAKHLALDALHFTAERFSLDLDLQKGDLEYFNNVTVFHARTSSEDSERNQRHLIRMWLSNEEQALPEVLAADRAKGLAAAGKASGWPLEAWEQF